MCRNTNFCSNKEQNSLSIFTLLLFYFSCTVFIIINHSFCLIFNKSGVNCEHPDQSEQTALWIKELYFEGTVICEMCRNEMSVKTLLFTLKSAHVMNHRGFLRGLRSIAFSVKCDYKCFSHSL